MTHAVYRINNPFSVPHTQLIICSPCCTQNLKFVPILYTAHPDTCTSLPTLQNCTSPPPGMLSYLRKESRREGWFAAPTADSHALFCHMRQPQTLGTVSNSSGGAPLQSVSAASCDRKQLVEIGHVCIRSPLSPCRGAGDLLAGPGSRIRGSRVT